MAVSLTGTKTVTKDQAPHATAAQLTALLAKAPEQLTTAEARQLLDALDRAPGGSDPAAVIGSVLV